MQMRDTHTAHHTPATVQRPPKLGRLTSLIGLRAFKALSDGPIRPKLHSYSHMIHTGSKATLGRPQTSKTHQQSPSSGSRHGPAKPNQTRAAHSVLTDAARLSPHILTKNKNPRVRPPRIPGQRATAPRAIDVNANPSALTIFAVLQSPFRALRSVSSYTY